MFRKKNKTEKTEEEKVIDEKERRATARFYAILLSVLAAVLLFFNFWSNNFNFVLVSGSSMDQTLYDGEYLLSYKVIYPEHEVKRGDIIVVDVSNMPEWENDSQETAFIIKRLIALEGDIVRCTDGKLEICYAGTWDETIPQDRQELPFVEIAEPYAYYDENYYDANGNRGKYAECNNFRYTVGEGEIFFLGDNRNHSNDSRYKQGYSALDRLYKMEDVVAIVPDWALIYQSELETCLVKVPAKIKNFFLKPFRG